MENNLIIMLGLPLILLVAFIIYRVWFKKPEAKKSSTQDFTGKFERRHYKFHNGLEACQEQLGLDQNEEFAALLSKVDIDEPEKLTMDELNKMLYDNKGMRDLLGIVLINNDGSFLNTAQRELATKLKDDEVEAVLDDFFTLNPQKKALFDLIKLAAVSKMSMVQKSSAGITKRAG